MRLLPAALLLCLSPAALAQVSTNDQALETLNPAPAAPAAHESAHRHARHARAAPHAAAAAPHPVAAPLQKLQVPAAPPANPVIAPPPLVMPAHPPPPPPPVPMRAGAAGTAAPLPDGTRITFGAGSATLNPATFNAILAVADAARANPAMVVGVTAWAPGTADDPSTPRRLSLDRALAARAVLIANGVISERIRTIAKGMNDIGAAPADRVDITEILPPAGKK